MQPLVIRPFSDDAFAAIQKRMRDLRWMREGEACNMPTWGRHDWHKPSFLLGPHAALVAQASEIFGEPVKASYSYAVLYGSDGVCSGHIDRPQCKYTIDLCVDQVEPWAIYIGVDKQDRIGEPYALDVGEALCFSGTDQWHYRKPISSGNWVAQAFFHFVPLSFRGSLD